jgi:hypothetical protein
MAVVSAAVMLYLGGAALALWRTDASWPIRVVLALLWPIGPVAFVLTVCLLLAASMIAFPLAGVIVAAAALAWWLVV